MSAHLGLRVDNLHKRFGEREVLRGVSLSARPGDVVAIIGSSGSGKSTLLRCLNLLEQPHEGTLRLGDETLSLTRDRDGSLRAADERQLRHWRARLAFVFQSFNLWQHRTALENVIEAPIHVLGQPREQAVERGTQLLAQVGLSHRLHVYPAQLSGGEQQRVGIARAIAKRPDVLLCDEPTGALDVETGRLVLEALDRVNRELGTITAVITHNASIAAMGHRVIRMSSGRIVEVQANAQRLPAAELQW